MTQGCKHQPYVGKCEQVHEVARVSQHLHCALADGRSRAAEQNQSESFNVAQCPLAVRLLQLRGVRLAIVTTLPFDLCRCTLLLNTTNPILRVRR